MSTSVILCMSGSFVLVPEVLPRSNSCVLPASIALSSCTSTGVYNPDKGLSRSIIFTRYSTESMKPEHAGSASLSRQVFPARKAPLANP